MNEDREMTDCCHSKHQANEGVKRYHPGNLEAYVNADNPVAAKTHCCGHDDSESKPIPSPAAKYFCTMCDGVETDKPGACPKCGMALERNPSWLGSIGIQVYTCPMHPEVEQDHPGSCSKCGMSLEAVSNSGYDEDNAELNDMQRRFIIGLGLVVPLLVLSMGAMLPLIRAIPPTLSNWVQLGLSTPVVLWAGWPFFARGWNSLVYRSLNMFTLIALGTGTSYLYSIFATALPGIFPANMRENGGAIPVYFEGAAVITVLVLMGQVLELRARAKTGKAIKALLNLAPKTARKIVEGHEEEVPLDQVKAGDLIRIKPGDKIPVDGIVIEGSSSVDESMISGEPMPIAKTASSKVSGGTVNSNGGFLMKAEHVGDETLLAQIVAMVSKAQRSRAPIQNLADTVAGWFVPAVLGSALLTFVLWFWLGPEPQLAFATVNAVAVLIIACPCALGLATPMSIMVGIGRGAQKGILIKNAESLEILEKTTVLVVDKTGTLTEGKAKVTRIIPASGISEDDLLKSVASIEALSEHPLAGAIVNFAKEKNLPLDEIGDFESITGGGVAGKLGSKVVLIGQKSYLEKNDVSGVAASEEEAAKLQGEGATVVFVSIDGQYVGLLALSDPLKPTTSGAVEALHRMQIRIVMLTGDNADTAQRIADQLHIDEVVAEVSPQLKQDKVMALKGKGQRVAMAGDGVNDAPALAAADVGIAMGTGTDVAMESAGVTLVKGNLQGIVTAIALSRATMKNIRQNLFFAFVYNIVGIPIAAGALYPAFGLVLSPMLASAAMSLSSVSVIGNALRLQSFEAKE